MGVFESIELLAHEVDEKTLIIVPTYNERENIELLLLQTSKILPSAHILVVDDRSPDGTSDVVKAFCQNNSDAHVELFERHGERGLGNAYRAGFSYGLERDYEIFVTMDADGSHSPLHLPTILSSIQDMDLVIGSRYTRDGGTINWRIRRILLSWLANRFARFVLQLGSSDVTSGFRAYRREVLTKIGFEKVKSNGYSFLVEMLFLAQRNGARVTEVPIIFFDRTMGKSKISKKEIYRGAFSLLRLRLARTRKTAGG